MVRISRTFGDAETALPAQEVVILRFAEIFEVVCYGVAFGAK